MEATKLRKVLRRLFWMSLVFLAALAAMPLWFPWIFKPILKSQGATYETYDRVGYSRFALRNLTVRQGDVVVTAQRVEGALPPAWLWRVFVNRDGHRPLLHLSGGELVIQPTGGTGEPGSLDKTLRQIVQTSTTLERWMPVAELTNCQIRVGSNLVVLRQGNWRSGRLNATVSVPAWRTTLNVGGVLNRDLTLGFSASSDAYQSTVEGQVSKTVAGWALAAEARWLTNRATITAQFPTNNWWPSQARIESPQVRIPSRALGLEGFEEARSSLALTVASNRFELQAEGTLQPSSNYVSAGFPVATFTLAADGDPDSLTVRTLRFESPWLTARLTNSVIVSWSGELGASPAQFRLSSDLSQIPGVALTGQLEGAVQIEPHGQESPGAQFALQASNVRGRGVDLKGVLVMGDFTHPVLKIDEIKVDLPDGSTTTAKGSIDLQKREVAKGEWKTGGGFLKQFVPGLNYTELTASGMLEGALTNLAHRGRFAMRGFKTGSFRAFNTDVEWSGQHQRLTSVDAKLAAGESLLSIQGAVDLGLLKNTATIATLTNVSFRRKATEVYALQKTGTIQFRATTNDTGMQWNLAVDSFDWRGPHRQVSLAADVSWPAQGQVKAQLTNVLLRDFSDFLGEDILNVSLTSVDLAAHWSNTPVRLAIAATSTLTNKRGQPFTFRGELAADDQLAIKRLSVETLYSPTVLLTGSVPVKFIPGGSGRGLAWNATQPMTLTGSWEDSGSNDLSLLMGKGGKLEIAKPQFHFQIAGTPDAPSASLKLAAARISWQFSNQPLLLPALADLQINAEVRPNEIQLETFEANMDSQKIKADGQWPLPPGTWRTLWSKGTIPDWDAAQGRLRLDSANLAAFSRYLPPVLAPEGRLTASLDLKTGKRVDGIVSVTNVSTRPLGPLAPLREVAALVRFDQHHASLDEFRARMGGQPVQGDGMVARTQRGDLEYRVNLYGTNVPLVRSLEFLLRGDLELHARSSGDLPTVVSGSVNLHDGLYVQHASALVWSGPRRPELHPPYFSVTNQPVADWRLDVRVKGDRFLRARTPLFSGLLSANMNLSGTFRQPVLTGDAAMNSGRIVLPFGSLQVDSGFASFSGNDPQGPNLQINASGRNYRHDIRLAVKGPAEIADISFTSTPPLTSEQILLMLTAGEVPQTDYSFTRTAKAGRLATFVGKDLWSRFMGSGRAEERLIIRTGEGISEEGNLTYSLEYRLSERWSIIGEYDEFNDFNADLKWKVFAR